MNDMDKDYDELDDFASFSDELEGEREIVPIPEGELSEEDYRKLYEILYKEEIPEDVVEILMETIQGLPEREKKVLYARIGARMTLEEVGRALDVTRERVRTIESTSYRRIRYNINRKIKETELTELQEEDQKCDEALVLVEELDKEQEGQTQGGE